MTSNGINNNAHLWYGTQTETSEFFKAYDKVSLPDERSQREVISIMEEWPRIKNMVHPTTHLTIYERAFQNHRSIITDYVSENLYEGHSSIFGESPLHHACSYGTVSEVIRLLEAGHSINACGSLGVTPLMQSVTHGREAIFLELLSRGARLSADSVQRTPLHHITEYTPPSIVKRLIQEAPGMVSAADALSWTPMHVCAKHDNVSALDSLRRAGASLNPRTYEGMTPLHIAAMENSTYVADFLIENGVDPSEEGGNLKYTPLEFSISRPGWTTSCTVISTLMRNSDRLPRTSLYMSLNDYEREVLEILYMRYARPMCERLLFAARFNNTDTAFSPDSLPKELFMMIFRLASRECVRYSWEKYISHTPDVITKKRKTEQ